MYLLFNFICLDYTIDLSLATKLRDWRVSEDGLINDNSASKRIRITKNNDK